jgi:HSP20 family molecular chaperone IbpA
MQFFSNSTVRKPINFQALPALPETDIETAKCAYNNGILEISFKKKVQPKGKTIRVD